MEGDRLDYCESISYTMIEFSGQKLLRLLGAALERRPDMGVIGGWDGARLVQILTHPFRSIVSLVAASQDWPRKGP